MAMDMIHETLRVRYSRVLKVFKVGRQLNLERGIYVDVDVGKVGRWTFSHFVKVAEVGGHMA